MAGTNTHWPYSAGVCPEDDLKQPCQWKNSKMYLRSWATLYQSFHVLGSYLLYPLAQAGSSCITFPSYWHKNVLPEPLSISNLSVLLVFSFSLLYGANLHKKKHNESYISFSFSKEAVVDDGNQSADHSQVSMNSSEFQSGESILSLLLQSGGDFVQQCLI